MKSPSAPPKDSVYEEARGKDSGVKDPGVKDPGLEAQVHLKKLSDYKTFSKVACLDSSEEVLVPRCV